jgi:predicted ArsR family transcriptional regulator
MPNDTFGLPLFGATYPHAPGYARGSETSRAAAAEAVAPKLRVLHRMVLECLLAAPLVIDEISTKVGKHLLIIRPRVTELKELGLVEVTKERGTSALGHSQSVVKLTEKGRAAVVSQFGEPNGSTVHATSGQTLTKSGV